MSGAANNELVLHVGLAKKKCRSCKREIVFAHTTSGKKAPFELDETGEYVMENGVAYHKGPPVAQLELGAPPAPPRYSSHFATCPDAPKWRGVK